MQFHHAYKIISLQSSGSLIQECRRAFANVYSWGVSQKKRVSFPHFSQFRIRRSTEQFLWWCDSTFTLNGRYSGLDGCWQPVRPWAMRCVYRDRDAMCVSVVPFQPQIRHGGSESRPISLTHWTDRSWLERCTTSTNRGAQSAHVGAFMKIFKMSQRRSPAVAYSSSI